MQIEATKCIAASQTLTGDRIPDGGGSSNPILGGAPRRISVLGGIGSLGSVGSLK